LRCALYSAEDAAASLRDLFPPAAAKDVNCSCVRAPT
jgi:hypothetical protein